MRLNAYTTGRTGVPLAAALVFLVLAVAGCIRPGNSPEDSAEGRSGFPRPEKAIATPVEASRPELGSISAYFETTTRVEAERRVDVSPKASARCVAIMVDEGDEVETGQILAELDKAEAQAQYDQMAVQVRQNETSYELAKEQYQAGLGPKIEMENAQYTYEQSLASLEAQRVQLENLTIRAPIDGVITQRDINIGMLVQPGTSVFSLVDPSSFVLAINPPEKELPRLSVGQRAQVRIDSLPGKVFEARIRRINPSVDPVSGTVRVLLDFDEETRKNLLESAFARVSLVMSTRENVLLLPKEAVVEEEGRQYVFILRRDPDAVNESPQMTDGADSGNATAGSGGEVLASPPEDAPAMPQQPPLIAERVEVSTGLEDNENVQILQGIEQDDLVVTNGQLTLKPGATVRVTNIEDELLAKADMTAEEALKAANEARQEGDQYNRQRRGRGGMRIRM